MTPNLMALFCLGEMRMGEKPWSGEGPRPTARPWAVR